MINEIPLNQVGLFVPDDLNDVEKDVMFTTIKKMLNKTHFHISFYRTSVEDILQFILTLPDMYYSHFTIHFISSMDYHSDIVMESIQYMNELGLTYKEHHLPVDFDEIASSNSYNDFVYKILEHTDEILSFYKRDKDQVSKLLKPLDAAKKYKKKSFIVNLEKDGALTLA